MKNKTDDRILSGRQTMVHIHRLIIFSSVNGEKSAFVLEKIYNDLHGIKFHKVPHWSEQIGVHNFLANHKDEFDSTGVIVKNDIFNQHVLRDP